MKFSIGALISGVVLLVSPLLAHSYQLHVLELTARSVLAHNGSASFPEEPTLFYCMACVIGVALIAFGCLLELREMRSASGPDIGCNAT